jgi:tetratricopeptide (TPR) repeat protein
MGDVIADLERSIAERPEDLDARRELAREYYLEGRPVDAVETLEAILELAPEHAGANLDLGALLLASPGTAAEAAGAHLVRATESDPSVPEAWVGRAGCEMLRGDLGEAETSAARAVELMTDRPDALLLLAEIRGRRENREGAAEASERALAIDPEGVEALATHAASLFRLDRHAECVELYGRLVDLEPGNMRWRFAGGQSRLLAGDRAGAEEAFRHVVELAPDDPLAWVGLGQVLMARERWEGALDAYGRVVDAVPEYTPGRLARASCLVELERWDDADAEIRRLPAGREGPVGEMIRGRIAEARGESANAASHFRRAAAASAGYAAPHVALARLAREEGRPEGEILGHLGRAAACADDPLAELARNTMEGML